MGFLSDPKSEPSASGGWYFLMVPTIHQWSLCVKAIHLKMRWQGYKHADVLKLYFEHTKNTNAFWGGVYLINLALIVM